MRLNLIVYHQDHTKFNKIISDIFSGFLNVMLSIMYKELDIRTIILISTKGERGYSCIIVPRHQYSL